MVYKNDKFYFHGLNQLAQFELELFINNGFRVREKF